MVFTIKKIFIKFIVFVYIFQAKTKLYFTTLTEIHEKITPLLQHKVDDRDEMIETVEMVDAMEEKSKEKESTDNKRLIDIKVKSENNSSTAEIKSEIKKESSSSPKKEKEKIVKVEDSIFDKDNSDGSVVEDKDKKELISESSSVGLSTETDTKS